MIAFWSTVSADYSDSHYDEHSYPPGRLKKNVSPCSEDCKKRYATALDINPPPQIEIMSGPFIVNDILHDKAMLS